MGHGERSLLCYVCMYNTYFFNQISSNISGLRPTLCQKKSFQEDYCCRHNNPSLTAPDYRAFCPYQSRLDGFGVFSFGWIMVVGRRLVVVTGPLQSLFLAH